MFKDDFVGGNQAQGTGQAQPNQGVGATQGSVQPRQKQVERARPQQEGNAQKKVQQGNIRPKKTNSNPQNPKKKGVGKLPFVLVAVVLLVIAVVGVIVLRGGKKEVLVAAESVYEGSGRHTLDTLQSSLNNYDPDTIDAVVGAESGDSYLAQEWAYINGVVLREEFVSRIGSLVKFEYPKVQQLSTTGVGMVDESGSPIMVDSYMNNGESMTVTVPDYAKLIETMDEDVEYISKLFRSSGYAITDYTFTEELTDLLAQYICDKDTLPTKTVEMTLTMRKSTTGEPYVESDAELDDILFGSDEFHNMCRKFSQLCTGWTGFKEEKYMDKELQHNPDYDDWYKIFIKYYEADDGVFHPRTSKWEPWYLRDENNEYVLDENGEWIVNYYTVKDENGNDWVQPAEEVLVDVWKTRQIEDPWVEETGVMYNWVGTNFVTNKYDGVGDKVFRVGDGSREHPAGIGTKIVTKVLGTDGKYHDIRVAMIGYWVGQDAIDYAEKFSAKNRGFTTSSVVSLICYELWIENLESAPIEFEVSEMALFDKNSNKSSRTGTMYGFSELVTVQPGKSVIINDWSTSTEIQQKTPGWGKSFERQYPVVYFSVLAGTGEIPPYSAYEQFTGKSNIDETKGAEGAVLD